MAIKIQAPEERTKLPPLFTFLLVSSFAMVGITFILLLQLVM